jgi:DNA-binding response OmpR family regulator
VAPRSPRSNGRLRSCSCSTSAFPTWTDSPSVGAAREGEEPPELLTFGDLVFDVQSRQARRAGKELLLSVREADLLEVLLRNPR